MLQRGIELLECNLVRHRLDINNWLPFRHDNSFILNTDKDVVSIFEFAAENALCHNRFQFALDGALERTRTVHWIETDIGEEVERGIVDRDRHSTFVKTALQTLRLDLDNLSEIFLAEAVEDDMLVDAVQKFWLEVLLHRIRDSLAHQLLVAWCIGPIQVQNILASDVAGENADGVSEVDVVTLAIGQSAIVQQLQHDVEDVWMRLFHFIEQQHGVRLSSHCVGQLASLVVSDVSWRRAEQS
mmetsp:Transcript_18106/g.51528  ORF Transcript_18106/g.51528 Transcript_18106/m.51528 type:complete len:242 (+) Transcript_18106:67-792(+)